MIVGETLYRVFGSSTFRGNPVTLFEVDALADSATLLRTARASSTEDNVFFVAADRRHVMTRFFSSRAELWLCGHGLLALAQHLHVPGETGVRKVHSTYGSWQIFANTEGPGLLIPAQPASEINDSRHWMHQALRSIGVDHQRLYLAANDVWIVLLRDMSQLQAIKAETIKAVAVGNSTPGALIATLRLKDAGYGFRYFAPWHGKPEDSGTGSAHCYLAPLMARSPVPVTALQFSPEGVAEMRVSLRGAAVAVAGKVHQCS